MGVVKAKPAYLAENTSRKIISIDAGRKYISVIELKEIIDKASLCGYTSVELVLGNDALRFFLDDMTITVGDTIYESGLVKAALFKGNQHYYDDPNGNALTQTELTELMEYAAEKNIEIIPVINSPGHMDAIIVAMQELKIPHPEFQTSKRTIDLDNPLAVAFTKSMLEKYVHYFSDYAKLFNFGCDEYANDLTDGGGWAAIQKDGTYLKFIIYVNELAMIAKEQGMEPLVFNDGIYYNNKTSLGSFDTHIMIAYWTAGWQGYDVAMPELLVEKGHRILNTNDGWYLVLGRKTVSDGCYSLEEASANINQLDFSTVRGATEQIPTIGSMQAIWADEPDQPLILSELFKLMEAYSERYFIE